MTSAFYPETFGCVQIQWESAKIKSGVSDCGSVDTLFFIMKNLIFLKQQNDKNHEYKNIFKTIWYNSKELRIFALFRISLNKNDTRRV